MRTGTKIAALVAAASIALVGCAADGDEPDDSGAPTEDGGDSGGTQPGTITVAVDTEFTAYNGDTAESNGVWNTYVGNGIKSGFWSYGNDASIVREEEFGTYELTSEDPLTVEYTINDETAWSDGEPIDCDDILLEWAATSGAYGSEEAPLFNPASTTGMEDVQKPECEAGDKEFTANYDVPFADWELVFSGGSYPAHVAAEQAGMTSDEFIAAVQADDEEALAPIAEFWNTGWAFEPGQLPDASVIPSSGPYLLTGWDAGQSVTLTANPDYYGTPAATETIVLRTLEPDQQLPALQNGEVDVISPGNPTVDTIEALAGLEGQVETIVGGSLTWSHIDMQQGAGRVFEDLAVRQAFIKCIPRELMVENLVRPTQPDAVVQDMREFFPVDDAYEAARGEAFPEDLYAETDVEGAAALLEEAGATGTTVRFMHAPDPVRSDVAALVASSCNEAGFDVQPFADPNWGEKLSGSPGDYDAVVFGWAGSGVVTSGAALYQTGANSNFYEYSNEEVDALWDEVLVTPDEDRQVELLTQIETLLWEDAFNTPLYTNPNVTAFSTQIEGVVNNVSQTGATFNMQEWTRAEG